jgi:CelD/BcsL family acetyltransferase involved in cellulose biosynthesis
MAQQPGSDGALPVLGFHPPGELLRHQAVGQRVFERQDRQHADELAWPADQHIALAVWIQVAAVTAAAFRHEDHAALEHRVDVVADALRRRAGEPVMVLALENEPRRHLDQAELVGRGGFANHGSPIVNPASPIGNDSVQPFSKCR